jgi:hypothetical protein
VIYEVKVSTGPQDEYLRTVGISQSRAVYGVEGGLSLGKYVGEMPPPPVVRYEKIEWN